MEWPDPLSVDSSASRYSRVDYNNHPFTDGNKRAGFLTAGLFLALNGFELASDQVEAVQTIMGVAAGKVSEKVLADWIRSPRSPEMISDAVSHLRIDPIKG